MVFVSTLTMLNSVFRSVYMMITSDDDDLNDAVAIDIAASVMITPGLEARLGYAHQDRDHR